MIARHPGIFLSRVFPPLNLSSCYQFHFYYYYFYSLRVFHINVSWWFLTWVWVTALLHNSSHCSLRSQQCCSLDSPHWSTYFQVLQSLYQSFGDCTKSANYNWYSHYFHVSQFFNSLAKSRYLSHFFAVIQFYSAVRWESKVHNSATSLFFCYRLVVWPTLSDPFVSQNPRGFCVSHSLRQILGYEYTIFSYGQTLISCTIRSGSLSPPSHA